MNCKKLLFIFLLLGALFIKSYGQQYFFRNYSRQEGMPQSTIYCITEDPKGYVWLGTEGGGLFKFDGIDFTNFTVRDGLSGNNIRALTFDKNGLLWIGTNNGLVIYNGNTFTNIGKDQGFEGSVILNFFEDDTCMWAATNDGGVNMVSLQNDTVLINTLNWNTGLLSSFVTDIYKTDQGKYILSLIGGINILEWKNGKLVIKALRKGHEIPSDFIFDIEADLNGILWFATNDHGVFTIEGLNNASDNYSVTDKSDLIKDNTIWKILNDDANGMWIATDKNGLFNIHNNTVKAFNTSNGLSNNCILSLYQSNDNILWIGTMGDGLDKYTGNHILKYNIKDGLPTNQIKSVMETKDGKILAGTNKGLYSGRINGDQISFNPSHYQLKDKTILSINGNDDDIWIGTKGNGVFNLKGNTVQNFTTENGLSDNNINYTLVEQPDMVWFASNYGYSLLRNGKFNSFNASMGFINNEVQKIIQSKNGDIWMATLGGLVNISETTYTDFDNQEGLFDNQVYCLATSKSNPYIYIGTLGGGLYQMLQNRKDTIIQVLNSEKLLSNNIYSLEFADDSTLIVGTDNGFNEIIFNTDHQVKQILSFNYENGFTGIETNLNALNVGIEDIWFGTIDGLFRVKRTKVSQNNMPKTFISNLKLFYNDVNWETFGMEKSNWFNIPKNPKFKHNQNHLTFEFTAIYHQNPNNILYSFRLVGEDIEWSPPSKKNESTYSNLKPGKYTFEVKATIDQINWSEPDRFAFITILPPFYQTTWFYILCVIVIITLIYIYIKYRERNLVKAKQILENEVKIRTKEIESQKEVIENKNTVLEYQKKQITDSIVYAEKIQRAVITQEAFFKESLPNSFVFFRPRDIVSGDFYWGGIKNDKIIITAADCTGHGVPGAFMSMLGVGLLNEIVLESGTVHSNDIVEELRKKIITSLHQSDDNFSQKDGMDIALCVFDKDFKTVEFTGAQNPLYHVREGKAEVYKGDNMPVAIHFVMEPFTRYRVDLQKGDMLYFCSDGYQDQFGGPRGKKFMKKRLRELFEEISTLPIDEQYQRLEKEFIDWKGEMEQIDDVLVIGVRVE